MLTRRSVIIAAWLIGLVVCILVIARTTFTADLSAFLPASPTKEQQVLLDQLQAGVVSRLILTGIEGGDAPSRAALSKEIARQLRSDPAFVLVNNGEPVHNEKDQAFLFSNRYLLSPAMAPERFTRDGLHAAIEETIDLIASPAGMLVKSLLPRDPTGEMLQLIEQLNGGNRPRMLHGAWATRDGTRALLLAQTRAAGADTDGQQQAMARIQQAFDAAVRQLALEPQAVKLVMTGPGVFSVLSRQTIEQEVTRLSIISTLIIVALLLLVYRSLTALALGLLPVVSGALVGLVAVSLGFGAVHGITLGFGITLIGEAVDYSIYLFVQSRQAVADNTDSARDWVVHFWPTIRLGVLTSITGFASLLLSGFPGLAQLGLFSIAGLIAAAVVTRFVLPQLLPANFRIRDVSALGARLSALVRHAPRLRLPLLALALAACAVVFQHRATLWNTELSSLSPVSEADQMIDARLRADMGAPDVRYMVVVSARERESALVAAEKVAQQLAPLVEQGVLVAFQNPAQFLPSMAMQKARQASLPAGDLQQTLRLAVADLPVRAEVLTPFIADIDAARKKPLLTRADLEGTSLALAVDSLLFERAGNWTAVLPVTVPADAGNGIAAGPVRAALAAAGVTHALFVDLKAESDQLYSGYLREAAMLSLGGLAGIVLLLAWSLRSPRAVARVLLPMLATVAMVVALLVVSGQQLTILHLVGLLLIVAVGSNYALFFTGPDAASAISPQTLTSLVFANMTTVAAFGLLGFSQVPVLQAIGVTVGPGAILALLLSAAFAGTSGDSAARAA